MSNSSASHAPDRPCPRCDADAWLGVEYAYGEPERYDGISEWRCQTCGYREGRWSHRALADGEPEPRYGIGRPTRQQVRDLARDREDLDDLRGDELRGEVERYTDDLRGLADA